MNKYIGMRYVPKIDGDWDNTKTYEPLTIVTSNGASYTSKTFVPKGIAITNTSFWVCTGNYNAQVELYRQELTTYIDSHDVERKKNTINVNELGIYGDGRTDYTDKIQELLTQKKNLFFPAGNYILSKELTVIGSCSITGAGRISSCLTWKANSTSAGIKITLEKYSTNESGCATLDSISLNYEGEVNYTALTVNGVSTIADRFSVRPSITNVGIGYGNAYILTQGWKNGIKIINCNGVIISGCNISGCLSSSDITLRGYGIHITAESGTLQGTQYLITDCTVNNFGSGVYADVFEGLCITGGVYLSNTIGIKIKGKDKYPHVLITNLHINATKRCIDINTAKQIIISDNVLYLGSDVADNIFIGLTNVSDCVVADNVLELFSDLYNGAMTLSSAEYVDVHNNTINKTNGGVVFWVISGSKNRITNNTSKSTYAAFVKDDAGDTVVVNDGEIRIFTSDTDARATKSAIWYNSTTGKLCVNINGTIKTFTPTA